MYKKLVKFGQKMLSSPATMLIGLLIALTFCLQGCGTIAGAGQDIQDGAEYVKEKMSDNDEN